MAITKIKPIKSTVAKAIRYICNPDKTEGSILIDSFCCAPETAAIEFQITANQGHRTKDRGTLAYHMLQSFSPGEVTAEEARAIGMEYAQAVLKGKYEFVLSTHIDRGHIHNHIIFNAVSFSDHKKYNDCTRSRRQREAYNDRICKAHDLSVIEQKSGLRGRSQYEYEHAQRGNSWKAKLKRQLDQTIKKAKSFDEFLEMMTAAGYEIKQGKYLSFRASGQERFTRSQRIGEMYTEENIRKRIADKTFYRESDADDALRKTTKTSRRKQKERTGRVYVLIDLQNILKAQKSTAYRNQLLLENTNRIVETINFLDKNNLPTNEDLLNRLHELQAVCDKRKDEIKTLEHQMHGLAEQIKFGKSYWKCKKIYRQSRKESVSSDFWTEENMQALAMFESIKKYMVQHGLTEKEFAIKTLIAQYNALREQRKETYEAYKTIASQYKEMKAAKENIEKILREKLESDEKESVQKDTKKEKSIRDCFR